MAYPKRAKKLLATGSPVQTGGSSKVHKAPLATGSPVQTGGSSKVHKAPLARSSPTGAPPVRDLGLVKLPELKVGPPPSRGSSTMRPKKASKLTGRANALTRGKGEKVGLKRIADKADVAAKAAATQRAKVHIGDKSTLAVGQKAGKAKKTKPAAAGRRVLKRRTGRIRKML